MVRHLAEPEGQRLVHRADRDPDADEGGRGDRAQIRSERASLYGQRRRTAKPGKGRSKPSKSLTRRASWRCVRDGLRCFALTGMSLSVITNVSPTVFI